MKIAAFLVRLISAASFVVDPEFVVRDECMTGSPVDMGSVDLEDCINQVEEAHKNLWQKVSITPDDPAAVQSYLVTVDPYIQRLAELYMVRNGEI